MNRLRLILSALLCALLFVQSARVGSSVADDDTTRINPELLTKSWSARWITVPNISPFDYGVYHFRRTFRTSGQAVVIRHSRHRRQPLSAFRKRQRVGFGTSARGLEPLAV